MRYVHIERLESAVREELEKVRQGEEPVIFLERGLTVGVLMVLPPAPARRRKPSSASASTRRRRRRSVS